MAGDALALGAAAFALTWLLSFWYRTERLREAFGVHLTYGDGDEPTDRLDGGGLGEWLNCPLCCALLCWLPVSAVYLACGLNAGVRVLLDGGRWDRFLPFAAEAALADLGGLGFALVLTRWWQGLRVKARWWE